MNVVVVDNVDLRSCLEDISFGDFFSYEGEVYLRVYNDSPTKALALRTKTDEIMELSFGTMVIPLNGHVVIKLPGKSMSKEYICS